ncbi:hypothetical protein BD410DRAFT_787079 [Rickenella mellea]|uniref:Oxo-4-hydroxy-4-carboxy-5-ureidoimidazoline decarboxylase domain-containing protein n=1 Tax=Rickenella mellea TaxID=50990 RepID=A0A4Y7Q9B7_9AGAM|nr:hypothetical protein BD410DRAFT_787079 [Rickenella mellea]
MADSPLPPLSAVLASGSNADSPLARALSTLLEPSSILFNKLVSELATRLTASPPVVSYTQVLDRAFDVVKQWGDVHKLQFVRGHPRIGEVSGLSKLSAQEQGGDSANAKSTSTAQATPPEVLERLAFLNKCYERRYPGLVYITFVNGRSRAAIRDELEDKLRCDGALPDNEAGIAAIEPHDATGDVWVAELNRAVGDVQRIARSRLSKLESQ